MKKLIMWNLITLDGYFQGKEDWDLSFHDLVWGKELEEFSIEQLKSADMIIFGLTTYQGMAAHWQDAEGEVADFMNKLPKAVCSSTLKTARWNNTIIIKNAADEISKLKQEGNGDLFVFGSGKLCESLMKEDLFDEYRLVITPVFLGEGRRLFNEGSKYQELRLIESRPLSNGGVMLRYANTFEGK
ncbi:MAG: dihydrofolate reductase family protein [Candidatus Thorarchaeota archaeon]